ncbi:hypothetical protein BV210_05000 [Halorientalis sp. IM1011]|nr:hypothetical protein BV210_05000 [Halorientalis sp. IM1011]
MIQSTRDLQDDIAKFTPENLGVSIVLVRVKQLFEVLFCSFDLLDSFRDTRCSAFCLDNPQIEIEISGLSVFRDTHEAQVIRCCSLTEVLEQALVSTTIFAIVASKFV